MLIQIADFYRQFCLYGGYAVEPASQWSDTGGMRGRFEALLPGVAVEVTEGLPAEWTADVWRSFAGAPLSDCGEGHWQALLPGDFMRLVSFRLDGWERAVTVAHAPGSASARLQSHWLKALRGSAERPRCSLACCAGGLGLCFDSDTEPQVAEALYVPRPELRADGTIEVARLAVPAILKTINQTICNKT